MSPLRSAAVLALLAAVGATVCDPKFPAKARTIVRGLDRCAVAVAEEAGRFAAPP